MHFLFGPFRLDARSDTLFTDGAPLAVGRRAVALLKLLVERPGTLVLKDEMLQVAWAGLLVEDSNLPVQIAALRKALSRTPGGATWIETLPRRGYRYVGPPVTRANSSAPNHEAGQESADRIGGQAAAPERARWIVGRDGTLDAFDAIVDGMLDGQRQIVFLAGEAGLGKTTLVGMAAERLAHRGIALLCGACIERFGPDEAFVPLIDAMIARCRAETDGRFRRAAAARAPSWLLHLPGLLDETAREAVQSELFGATRERMIREFCDLVAALAAEQPQVIVLEDLHWSDLATLDVLSRLARADRGTPLLVLATYRESEAAIKGHPVLQLHRTLVAQGQCRDLRIERLTRADIEAHLVLRFDDPDLAARLSPAMFARTNGQPLYLRSLLDCLVEQGSLAEVDGRWRLAADALADPLGDARVDTSAAAMPANLHRMIEHQIDTLSEEDQTLLETASVAGVAFEAALVAAGLSTDPLAVEQALERLARRRVALIGAGATEWADGSFSTRYAFDHALYQNVLYARLSAGRRAELHRRMGLRLEQAFDGSPQSIAPTLAAHFEQARDPERTIRYLMMAAQASAKRFGHDEASTYLSRALAIVEDRGQAALDGSRIALLRRRSMSRRSSGDLDGAIDDLRQMIAFAEAMGDAKLIVAGLLMLGHLCIFLNRRVCLESAEAILARSGGLEDPAFRALAQGSTASINLYLKGWRAEDAALCESVLAATALARDYTTLSMRCMIEGILACSRSRYRDCRAIATRGKQLTRESNDIYVYVLFHTLEATASLHCGEWKALRDANAVALELADRNANLPAKALCQITLAWLHVEATDHAGAVAICAKADPAVVSGHPFAYAYRAAVLAKAHLGLRQFDEARHYCDVIRNIIETDGTALDCTIATQFYYAIAELSLLVGDLDGARRWTRMLRDYTFEAPDRNHLALAYSLQARLAWAEDEAGLAKDCIARAVATLGDDDLPLAAWRVFRSAADLSDKAGRACEANGYRTRCNAVLDRLAGNFPPADPLHRALGQAMAAS